MIGLFICIKYLDRRKFIKIFISLFCSFFWGTNFNLLLNLKSCPDCYSNDLCRYFQNADIQLTWFSSVLSIINPELTKSVFYGVFNSSQLVVIKRKVKRTTHYFLQNNESEFSLEIGNYNLALKNSDVFFCPDFNNIELLINNIDIHFRKNKLWLNLSASIEPLLLLYFESLESLGKLPVSKYLGACGDLIVQEYNGVPLSNFFSASFEIRAFLALKLLKMANAFTFGSPDFIFYFTDVSQYNLVVDSSGNVLLVDLDNVIIYDKKNFEKKIKAIHQSEIWDKYEYSFSPSDICNHCLSDHNYFVICVYILTQPEQGLLLEILQNVSNTPSDLNYFLSECREPRMTTDRIFAGLKLQNILEKIFENNSDVIKDYFRY